MSTFVTILYLLSPEGLTREAIAEYPSDMECGKALLKVDGDAHCETTNRLGRSPRPKSREASND